LPSATEIAVALGLGENLVGRSHECDFPAWTTTLPVVTRTKLQKGLTSGEIDRRVQDIVRQGLSVYEVDAALLRELKPDIILTQTQCAVCAVTPGDLEESLNAWTGREPALVSLAPDALGDVWGDLRRVGEAAGVTGAAESVIASLQGRLEALRHTAARVERPTVGAIEWIEPLMAAGNWIPELIEIAGGRALFAKAGEHSPWLSWETLIEADPEFIVAMPCGYRIAQTTAEWPTLTANPAWRDLKAVRNRRVAISDGHHFFNRPGPRLLESAEILAEVLGHGVFGHEGRGWVRAPA
jgi:iron complex transport system substrate-binding protein